MKEIDSFLKEHDKNLQEVLEARKDYRGNINKSIEDRLNADQDEIYNRFNNATLLPYSDQYITAENSYKGRTSDLVLKGRTLQNVAKFKSSLRCTINGNEVTVDSEQGKVYSNYISDATILKKNTEYTLVINIIENTLEGTFFAIAGGENQIVTQTTSINYFKVPSKFVGLYVKKFTIRDDVQALDYTIQIKDATSGQIKYIKPIILEGDWSNKPIPGFFEGIKSVCETGETFQVKSCGKNLWWDIPIEQSYAGVTIKGSNGEYVLNGTCTAAHNFNIFSRYLKAGRYSLKANNDTLIPNTNALVQVYANNGYITINNNSPIGFIATMDLPENSYVFRIRVEKDITYNNFKLKPQLEEGTTATQYESYTEDKTDSLKDLNLRGLDDTIRDTLDSKGVLSRNVARVVFKGGQDENWGVSSTNVNTVKFYIIKDDRKQNTIVISDKFKTSTNVADEESILGGVSVIAITINKSRLTGYSDTLSDTQKVNLFKAWLKTNPTTVYYQLAAPTTEAVEGMKELNTYDKVTHIFQEGTSVLQGDIECKVPTNVQATIATLRLENKALAVENTALKTESKNTQLNSIENALDQDYRLTVLENNIGR